MSARYDPPLSNSLDLTSAIHKFLFNAENILCSTTKMIINTRIAF